ncbi:hypothetical protein VTH06DRAFT_5880 [Thermothelomyces fergusii]
MLEIPHTCCRMVKGVRKCTEDPDVDEIEDEHAHELELLETLLDEFQRNIMEIVKYSRFEELSDFWKDTWPNRMHEILSNLNGDNLSEAERKGGEEIGVAWCREPVREEAKDVESPAKDMGLLARWAQMLGEIEADGP